MSSPDRHADRLRRAPPAVVARCAGDAGMREVRAGLEEEGVPVHVESALEDTAATAADLAFAAAQASSFGVGIGIDAAGGICVHHVKRPRSSPVVTTSGAHARLCGHNAARLVVGLPLKTMQRERVGFEKENKWPHH